MYQSSHRRTSPHSHGHGRLQHELDSFSREHRWAAWRVSAGRAAWTSCKTTGALQSKGNELSSSAADTSMRPSWRKRRAPSILRQPPQLYRPHARPLMSVAGHLPLEPPLRGRPCSSGLGNTTWLLTEPSQQPGKFQLDHSGSQPTLLRSAIPWSCDGRLPSSRNQCLVLPACALTILLMRWLILCRAPATLRPAADALGD